VRPTPAAEELKRNITQYLSTTFALADQPVRDGLERFLNHPDHGIFRGPYLQGEAPPEAETTLGGIPREPLPAVYCRHCGRSGWASISPEKDPADLDPDATKVYRAGVSRDKRLVRTFIEATPAEVRACAAGDPDAPTVLVLDASGRRIRPLQPSSDAPDGE
jgi:hypothetical protein